MRKRGLFVTCFLLFSLFVWSSSAVLATPLALNQNIRAIVAHQGESTGTFTFVVLGDSRDGAETYKRVLLRAMTLRPLFILHTGDLVTNGKPSEYEDYMKQVAPLPISMLHLPGNHDVRSGTDAYRKYVGEPNWYFDLGNLRIIALDNASGAFSPETLSFARKTLTSRKVCLVAFHKPPPLGRWTAHAMQEDGHEIMNLIKEAKAPIVFLGHLHLYDEMDIGGAKYIISAGGGAPLHGKYDFGKAEYGFVVVRVTPKGITHQWVPLEDARK
jgi:hypothetical protein